MTTIHSYHRDLRAQFLETLGQNRAAAVLFSGSEQVRNNDCHFRFRPDSDFFYLTGFDEPESVLVLRSDAEEDGAGAGQAILFLRERNAAEETWTGRRMGTQAAPEAVGIDAAFPITELWDRLPELLEGHERVVYRSGEDEARDRALSSALAGIRGRVREGRIAPLEQVDPSGWLHEMRLFKSSAEIDCMRRAADITTEAHLAAMAAATPGMGENELDALIEYTFKRRGSTGPAYTNIVAGGVNACILHYIQNNAPLGADDLILIDAGAEVDYYASDVTRSFPVNGRFSEAQRSLYEVVLAAQEKAIEAIRPGASFQSIHEIALECLVTGLIELGLVEGPLEDALESEDFRRFFMHRTSHWLGLDVHDCGRYFLDGESRPLEPGMVMTVEPGLYIAPEEVSDGDGARFGGIGIRIEDDVLVTPDGHEVLTAGIPKSVAAIEAACAATSLPTPV